jgi:hypothetical protein
MKDTLSTYFERSMVSNFYSVTLQEKIWDALQLLAKKHGVQIDYTAPFTPIQNRMDEWNFVKI